MEKNWKNLHRAEDDEPIGAGAEKIVYESRINPEHIVGEYREDLGNPREVQARFYLTKIVHILFPENIPDIHLSASAPNSVVRDRVSLDKLSKAVQLVYKKRQYKGIEDPRLPKLNQQAHLRQGNARRALSARLEAVGVHADDFLGNFAYDTKGKFKYFEDFRATSISGSGELYRWFDESLLRTAIEKITDEKVREQAQKYFKRLMELVAEEEKAVKP